MKEEKTKSKKKLLYYLILAVCVLLLTAATVLTVYFVTGDRGEIAETPTDPSGDEPTTPSGPDDDKDVSGGDETVRFVAPLADTSCAVEHNAIYTNLLNNWSYRHRGVDFTAEAEAEVYAIADGEVTDVLYSEQTGNIIVIDHGDGLTSVYRYVEPVKGLGKGDTVKQGDVIATVAEAYGAEYLDGTHLHFEIVVSGKYVDPMEYIDSVLDEK